MGTWPWNAVGRGRRKPRNCCINQKLQYPSKCALLQSSPQCNCCTDHISPPPAPPGPSAHCPPVRKPNCLPLQHSSFYAHWCRQQCGCGNRIFALIQKDQITQSSITVNVNPQCSAPPIERSNQLLSKFNTSACQTSAMSTTSGNLPQAPTYRALMQQNLT